MNKILCFLFIFLSGCITLDPLIPPPKRLKNIEKIVTYDSDCQKTINEIDLHGHFVIKNNNPIECPVKTLLQCFDPTEIARIEAYIEYLFNKGAGR